MEFRKTHEHGNADALSHFPVGNDHKFHGEETGEDVDNVCTVRMISHQIMLDDPKLLVKETSKDPVITRHALCEGRLDKPMFKRPPGLKETG